MISIQLIDTKNAPVPNGRELRNKILLRPIGIPDHAWKCTIRSLGTLWPLKTMSLSAVWYWFPWILRNQNPINANGGRDEPTRQGIGKLLVNVIVFLQVQRD
jgi:hypothetical protein